MSTIDEVITDALEITGMKSPHEDLTDEWGAIGLRRINSILDGWNVDKTHGYAVQELEFNLEAGKSVYAIGPIAELGGNIQILGDALLVYGELVFLEVPPFFDTGDNPRPVKITNSFTVDSSNVKHNIGIVNYKTFHNIEYQEASSSYPCYMWYNPRSPLGEIHLYPTPSESNKIHLDCYFGFASYVDGDDTLVVPQGYERLLTFQLATELCSHRGKQIPPAVYKTFKEIEQNVEAVNFSVWMPDTKILTPNTNTVAESNYIWMNRGI